MKNILLLSYSSLKSTDNLDDYKILNSYLKDKSNITLAKKNYFNRNTLGYFGMYKKWYDAELKTKDKIGILFNGKVDWIFTKEDLKYMKKNILSGK